MLLNNFKLTDVKIIKIITKNNTHRDKATFLVQKDCIFTGSILK